MACGIYPVTPACDSTGPNTARMDIFSELSFRDCLLFALFLKFPKFFQEDFYFEHFVPFKNEKLQKYNDFT
jgi:hypothetical protein